ncbi:MAG: hypothetical protein HOO96_41210, partial [Polyangiaceae bacterium]|nr:hypothetical protein [Polyangiaceae bacterium]
DRAHVEAAHAGFGAFAWPLEDGLAARAREARPDLPREGLLVTDGTATLVHPADDLARRLASLETAGAPEVILADTRADLAIARGVDVRLEWERVHPWPAPHVFPGTVAFGEIARVMAAHTLPLLLGAGESGLALAAIDAAADAMVLTPEALAYRHALDHAAVSENALRRRRGLELSVRFLDELGHTDRLSNQDTLVDDCHFTLAAAGLAEEAAQVHRIWLERAVPAAWRRVRESAWPSGADA